MVVPPWISFLGQKMTLPWKINTHGDARYTYLIPGIKKKYTWTSQEVYTLARWNLSHPFSLHHRIIWFGTKYSNWPCLTSIPCGIWRRVFNRIIHKVSNNTSKLSGPAETKLKVYYTRKYQSTGYVVHAGYLKDDPRKVTNY